MLKKSRGNKLKHQLLNDLIEEKRGSIEDAKDAFKLVNKYLQDHAMVEEKLRELISKEFPDKMVEFHKESKKEENDIKRELTDIAEYMGFEVEEEEEDY